MANLEKLVKAFEVLKVFQPGSLSDDPTKLGKKEHLPPTKKEKIANCNVIADCICSPTLRSVADFPKFLGIAVETFLLFCDDGEPDVRMVADECLNRTVKTLLETNLGRLQVELYKEIKKNGSSRTLRAALWRFAEMCYLIRPQKCRPYVVNLLPCINRICQREEEAIQETLSTAMHKIAPVLMGFATDNEIKALLKAFLPNLKSSSACTRRTAASSLSLICQCTRKPMVFFKWLLDVLLDMVIPVNDEHHVPCLLGVLLCLRHMLPHLVPLTAGDPSMQGSFGRTQKEKEVKVKCRSFLQIYELLLHYTDHVNHNVVTASLETLQQLFRHPSPELISVLTTAGSVTQTTIYEQDQTARTIQESQPDLKFSDDCESSCTDDSAQIMAVLGDGERDFASPGKQDDPDVFESGAEASQDDMVDSDVLQDDDTTYSDLEIGAINDDAAMSVSSSDGHLSGKDEAGVTLRRGASEDLINANTLYDETYDDSENGEDEGEHIPMSEYIGTFAGSDVPMLYCVRLLCSRFLLGGTPGQLIPDRTVRVSVKALALGCIISVVNFYPQIMLCHLYKDNRVDNQAVRDILLYGGHSDPQLKGSTAVLAAHLLRSFLVITQGKFDLENYFPPGDYYEAFISVEDLVKHILDGLLDENSVTTRMTLANLKTCLNPVLHSIHSLHGLYILLKLAHLHTNSYWLVKVELLELMGQLDMRLISYLETVAAKSDHKFHCYSGHSIQSCIMDTVVFGLLGDDDYRVRHAAASAIVSLVPNLFYIADNQDPVTAVAKELTESFLRPIIHEWSQPAPPLIHGLVWPYHSDDPWFYKQSTELNLSRVVALLVNKLTRSTSKHLTSGCCHALFTVSEAYPVTQFAGAWCCSPCTPVASKESLPSTPSKNSISGYNFNSLSLDDLSMGLGGGSLPLVLSLLTSSSVTLDLNTHRDALLLAANLFAGASYKCLKKVEDPGGSNSNSDDGHWGSLQDRLMVPSADSLLSHLAKLLNICSHVVEEQPPGPPHSKPVLPSLPTPTSISPMRKKAKDKEAVPPSLPADAKQSAKLIKDKEVPLEKEKNKKENLGTFHNLPHYTKLFENLKGAYSNYQISLDLNVVDKFGCLLSATLQTLGIVLEVACLPDIGKYTEEFLSYLKTSVVIQPTHAIMCVQQLLKALFGTNLACQYEGSSGRPLSRTPRLGVGIRPGLYQTCFSSPYAYFTQSVHSSAALRDLSQNEQDDNISLLGWLRRRAEKKIPAVLKPGSKTDKNSIANYIRLFEPLVIKALKQYTVSSSLDLQKQVLQLLSQLVQLRVNYCLLDSDQIFIGFVIKQFEYIEEGQIRNSEILVPCMFHFLVLLSYERYHSKAIIGMPKIIQLCDGIMASGLNPVTHAIPCLQPIVYDLFVLRGSNKADVNKDLDTQREVVISMLFRLIHYYQVLELFIVVLHQSRRESDDKWKRLSRQVVDSLFPCLSRLQINIDCQKGLDVIHRLMESVAPSVFRPVDVLLTMLYAPIHNPSLSTSLHRWLGCVLVILRVFIAQSKEEVVLSRQQELNIAINIFLVNDLSTPTHAVPSSVTETPEDIMSRFLIQVVGLVATEIQSRTVNPTASCRPFLCQQLSHLLLYISHMFQSGQFRRVATAAMSLLRQSKSDDRYYSLEMINSSLAALSATYPTLTLQWCNILILLNYDEQSFWSQVMQTPRRYGLASPRQPEGGSFADLPFSHCCNFEVVRCGGLVLFCDYVCENLSDAEHMTWVIVNHVTDLIELSHEPPVQDLISAIHRNSAASGLLIQAIHSRCVNLTKPSVIKKTLQSLEAVHLSQSGALLTLLVDKFLNTHHLAVARMCDSIACRRVEMLLTETDEERHSQMPLEDLEKLVQFMKQEALSRRYPRLSSLLNKLRIRLCPESSFTLSPEKTHPLVLTGSDAQSANIDKQLYISITQDQCFRGFSPRETTALLSKLPYSDILAITMTKEFHLPLLAECIRLGTQLALASETPTNEHPLLQAAQLTLLRHLNNLVNMLPAPHSSVQYSDAGEYSSSLEEVAGDPCWMSSISDFTSALLEYFRSLNILPGLKHIPDEAVRDVCCVAFCSVEAVHKLWKEEHTSVTEQLAVSLSCLSAVLQNHQCTDVISHESYITYVCSTVNCLYQLLSAMLLVPGEELTPCARIPPLNGTMGSTLHRTCQQVSDLVYCLNTRLKDKSSKLPHFLLCPLQRVIVGLARLPAVNAFARTASSVWRYGWNPSLSGGEIVKLPPLPVEFLQEKDVLQEFMFRALSLGWTSRQQFEETWMSLLGVLNPVCVSEEMHTSPEEDIHRSQCTVLALRCITALLLQSTLTPNPGNPCCEYEHHPRDKPLTFFNTQCGQKLLTLRSFLETEIVKSVSESSPADVSHIRASSVFCGNPEKELCCLNYTLGQMSTESIWSVVGMLDVNLQNSEKLDDQPIQPITLGVEARERSSSLSGLDLYSCLQFLLDLYSQWLSCNITKSVLMQVNETVKSIVTLSDLFTEKHQFDWMLETLAEVQRVHPLEDEILGQYMVVGMCKAAAVVGMDMAMAERICKLVEANLRSAHLPTRTFTLWGSLYLLESGINDATKLLIPILTEYLLKHISAVSHTSINVEQHLMLLWAVTFYIMENFQEELEDSDQQGRLLQLATGMASSSEEITTLNVYVLIMRGLERLVLASVLTKSDVDTLVKLSMDKLSMSCPQRAMPALALMLTCMYVGKEEGAYSPDLSDGSELSLNLAETWSQDTESLIVAMERVTILFDRIRKGFPCEADLLTRILPSFLADFFPSQDIMNKVIGEFLSNQQPHPQLMANVLFEVFDWLMTRDLHAVVRHWVMLSLSNFTQRTPLSMAVWSLTCFFTCSSSNPWLRALLPHITSRMGKMDTIDHKLFCIAASDFYQQLPDANQRRIFVSTFQSVSPVQASPYAQLLQLIADS